MVEGVLFTSLSDLLYCVCGGRAFLLGGWRDSIPSVVLPSASRGLPRWFSGKESTCQSGDSGLILGSRRSPGEGNSNPLQYSCLGNPMDRETWRATVHGVAKSQA